MQRIVPLVLVVAALAAPPAHATAVTDGSHRGAPSSLPLNVGSSAALVSAARTLPAVQTMIRRFASYGYVAHPESDQGVVPVPGENAAVCLAFEQPGYVAPDRCKGAPLITVATALVGGRPTTVVSGDFVVVDTLYRTMSFQPVGGGDGGSLAVSGQTPDRIDLTDEQRAIMLTYVACAGTGNTACLFASIGAAPFGPAAYATAAVCCVMVNTGRCLTNAISDWFHHH